MAARRLLLFALSLAVVSLGCTHTMEVRNLHAYTLTAKSPRSLKLEVAPLTTSDSTSGSLQEAVRDGLASHSSVERVTLASQAPPDFKPDYLVYVSPLTQFDGSGWNYAVTFPGFLIFTHAWNGFVYEARTTTSLELRRPGSEDVVASRSLETDWDLRHCDFGRGAWTSSGWYTPFYGGINLIIGFFMIQYDDGATEPWLAAIHKPYGDFMANNVIELAAGLETAAQPAEPPAEAPPPAPSASAPAEATLRTDPPSPPP